MLTMPTDVQEIAADVSADLAERVEAYRRDATQKLDPSQRSMLGQFLTPWPIARLMGSMFRPQAGSVRLLDAGAGVGSLFAAFVAEICSWPERPEGVSVTAYEVDQTFADYLDATLKECRRVCRKGGMGFVGRALTEDFIRAGADLLGGQLFGPPSRRFTCAILNPPYHKINSDSQTRRRLRATGIETSNLYSAFLALAVKLLESGGQLVAITPRSFCNGPYFKPFRKAFLRDMSIQRIHVFHSRDRAFREDEVLQENVILHAVKGAARARVTITASLGADDPEMTCQEVDYSRVVRTDDPEAFIRIVTDEDADEVAQQIGAFTTPLDELGIAVSTGRVVDFRAKPYLRAVADERCVPLIYPCHLKAGFVAWPKANGKKPNAIVRTGRTENILVPSAVYVLVKRFSAKEERRRIVAAVYAPARLSTDYVGFENHLNYFHRNGRGLPEALAKGLAVYLNSSLVDDYFRQFSGHTQVNATDLRSLRYPTKAQLEAWGSQIGDALPCQEVIDCIVGRGAR